MMKFALGVAALAAPIVLATPAQAAVTLTITDVQLDPYNNSVKCILPSNGCYLKADALSPGFNTFVNDGDSWNFDFGVLKIASGLGGDKHAGVTVDFGFDPIATGDTGDNGTGKYATVFGLVSGGVLNWDSNAWGAAPLLFTAAGAQFQLTLDNVGGVEWGNSAVLRGTITMLSAGEQDVPGVPEPASWALMLFGFGAMGGVMRTRRNTDVSFG